MSSDVNIILVAIYGFVIIFSFSGYGYIIGKILLPIKDLHKQIILQAGYGIAFMLFIGGILNTLEIISPIIIIAIIIIGNILFVSSLIINCIQVKKSIIKLLKSFLKPLEFSLLLTIFVLLIIRYTGSLNSIHFNWGDDFQGYILFPIKMLQIGHIGDDPFSYRRIQSLDGMPFLHAITLGFGNIKNLKLMDIGIGSILISGIIYEFGKYLNIPLRWILFVISIFLLIPPFSANISAVLIGITLLFIIILTVHIIIKQGVQSVIKNSILIGLILSGLIVLKSTYIIPIFYLYAGFGLCAIISIQRKLYSQLLIFIPIITILFLIPWMLANYNSNGTLLYPIFGNGFHGSSYGHWITPTSDIHFMGLLNWIPFILLESPIILISIFYIIILFFSQTDSFIKLTTSIVYISLLGTISTIIILTEGYGWGRYNWALMTFTLLFVLLIVSSNSLRNTFISSILKYFLALLCFFYLIFFNGTQIIEYFKYQLNDISRYSEQRDLTEVDSGEIHNVIDCYEVEQYYDMQSSVPEGEKLLAHLRYPFLLDFNRNNIFCIDIPGGSSPPPGIPSFQGTNNLVQYLKGLKINYIAYSYNTNTNYNHEVLNLRINSTNTFIKEEAKHILDFHNNLDSLSTKFVKIYQDNDIYVLDLTREIN